MALNIPYLIKELQSLTDRNVLDRKILVSDRAQIVMPYHILFDQYMPYYFCVIIQNDEKVKLWLKKIQFFPVLPNPFCPRSVSSN